MHKIILGFAGLIFTVGSAFAQSSNDMNQFSFVNLQNNESIEINYISQGCFHNDNEAFIFSATSVEISPNIKHDLSLEEQIKLDRYFNYVANLKEPGGCTTRTRMLLTLLRNGEAVASRSLVDATCGHGGPKNMLSPGSLRYQLLEPEENVSLIPESKN